jgi:hypothetical protein
MKPWNELSDIEKREAIALRVGWKRMAGAINDPRHGIQDDWMSPENIIGSAIYGSYPLIPAWPNDDGQAFKDLWRKLLYQDEELCLGLSEDSDGDLWPAVKHEGWIENPDRYMARSWASALCKAAYDLLPEAPSS